LKSAWSNWSRRIKIRFNIEKIKKVKFIAVAPLQKVKNKKRKHL
jgi:hypothetical protein